MAAAHNKCHHDAHLLGKAEVKPRLAGKQYSHNAALFLAKKDNSIVRGLAGLLNVIRHAAQIEVRWWQCQWSQTNCTPETW